MRTHKWTETIEHEQLEPEIGEVFEWKGMKLKCIITPSKTADPCSKCSIESKCRVLSPETHPNCIATLRKDGENVYFIKYEEPKFTQEDAQEMQDIICVIAEVLDDGSYAPKILKFLKSLRD